ncbi:MAG: DJ-1/PfpI family protein [Alphaproteobacteria bacterium]
MPPPTAAPGARRILLLVPSSRPDEAPHRDGLRIETFAAAFYALRDAGLDVVIAAPAAGYPPVAPIAAGSADPVVARFARDREAREELGDPLPLDRVFADEFDALLVLGGPAALTDFAGDARIGALVDGFAGTGRPVAAIGGGRAALLPARDGAGRPLVRGRRIAALAADRATGLDAALAALGAAARGEAALVVDGPLITAVDAAAGAAAAALLAALGPPGAGP